MKILALDVGTKNIGMAVSDELMITAQALETIRRKGNLAADLAKITDAIKKYEVSELLLGMPRNMNGTYGPSADMVNAFAEDIKTVTDLPIIFRDERLTSQQAEKVMLEADVSRKKRRQSVDSLAAILILQNYLDYLLIQKNKINNNNDARCNMSEQDENIVTLIDEEGKEHEFEILEMIEVSDKEYAVLTALEEEDDDEAVIFRIDKDDKGEEILLEIESDEEWEEVCDAYQQLMDEE